MEIVEKSVDKRFWWN